MSRNIKTNFKQYNTSFMKTLSKQTTDTQYDINISSFHETNNFLTNNNIYKTNIYTYTNNSNTKKRNSNKKIKIKNKSFQKFALISDYNTCKNKYKNNLYLFNKNTLNNESQSFSKYKKRIKAKTKEKLSINNFSNIKKSFSSTNKTDCNSLNISKKSKLKSSKDKSCNFINEQDDLVLKKSNTSKRFNIKIQKCYNKTSKKLSNQKITNNKIKTNINSPLGSDRDEKKIISLNLELTNKNSEINNLKKKIEEQNKYITELQDKIKNIIDDKLKEDVEYEQYSKKMILRNIKVLTDENEILHKQVNEYKNKEIKIMKALYYLNKQGISIDSFLKNINDEK